MYYAAPLSLVLSKACTKSRTRHGRPSAQQALPPRRPSPCSHTCHCPTRPPNAKQHPCTWQRMSRKHWAHIVGVIGKRSYQNRNVLYFDILTNLNVVIFLYATIVSCFFGLILPGTGSFRNVDGIVSTFPCEATRYKFYPCRFGCKI